MKEIIFALFTILLPGTFMAAPHKKPVVKCLKQSGMFVVDGKTTDRKTKALRFDNKTGFAYAFSNDSQSLFVQLKMLDASVQRKVLITGLTLWVDPNGKGKHVLGIEYPPRRIHKQHTRRPGQSPGRYGQRRPVSGNHPTTKQISRFNERYRLEHPKLEGFDKAGLKDTFAGVGGIRVLLQMDTLGHIIYEARISLKMLFSNPAQYLSKDKLFSVLFETGYLQMDMSRMQGQGGLGGGGGMGIGHQPYPSRMVFLQSMAEASRLKIKSIHLFQEK